MLNKNIPLLAGFLCFLFVMQTSSVEIQQLEKETDFKSAFLDGKLPTRAPVPWKFGDVYESISFESPFMTRIKKVPGEDQFLVLGVDGKAWLFNGRDRRPQPKNVLDISQKVTTKGSGLSGVAFHPKFEDPSSPHYRELFLYYAMGDEELPYHSILAKFLFSPNLDSILTSSEEILIQQYDRSFEHDGGALFFDQEGFLYLTVGDEGFPYTQNLENGQSIENRLFGGILRIDVDMDETRSHPIRRKPLPNEDRPKGVEGSITQNYFIPDSNPWVDSSGKYLEEFYAVGLRSPYTAFYDTLKKEIWVADVGNALWEELSIVSAKSNAMWPYFEGPQLEIPVQGELLGNSITPAHFYGRDVGTTIIGGFIYRGNKHPTLNGSFIFGDFGSGNVWSYNSELENPVSLLTRGIPSIVAFFPCLDDGICAMGLNGQIWEIQENVVAETIPKLLSESGAFDNLETLTPSGGIMPYEINAPLWSDGSTKKRWISLPDTSKIVFDINDTWTFPEGTVLIKHFELAINEDSIKRLETRFFVVDLDKNGYGLTYRWNSTDTEAILVGSEEAITDTLEVLTNVDNSQQIWSYPTRSQCLQCHNNNADFVLGLKTAQMNRNVMSTGPMGPVNQIELWRELDFFKEHEFTEELPSLSSIGDTTFSLQHRVRSYLDANCSHCHQPFGVNTNFDARFATALPSQKILSHEVVSQNSITGNNIITPGNTESSEMWIRDASLGSNKMPPIAKSKLDEQYLNVLTQWIESIQVPGNENEILIFPNPIIDGRFNISTDLEAIDIKLYDNTSREIPIRMPNIETLEVELIGHTPVGIYSLIYQTKDKMYVRKIIIVN